MSTAKSHAKAQVIDISFRNTFVRRAWRDGLLNRNLIVIVQDCFDCYHLLMNTLIISTFSCTYETFEKDVSGFITDMGKEVVSDYEFVKVNNHKSHLLMNVINMDALCTEMTSDKAKEWDKANNCEDTVYGIELVE